MVFLDCGNIDRMPVDFLRRTAAKVLNIDHHHDNTRFGDVNLVDVEASCTAEIVFELAGMLGVELTTEIANALYVGLVTDTGKFMYENTDARSHRMAAALIEAGVEVNDVYRRLYEHAPLEKLTLLARALENIGLHGGGTLAVTYISADDYEATGAGEVLTEGIIDHLRTIDGTAGGRRRPRPDWDGRSARKVSLRSTDGSVDVSEIAREQGGGGHRRAAGFGTDLELRARSSSSSATGCSAALLSHLTAALLVDKPAGVTSHDVVARVRRERRGLKVGPRRDARPVRDRPADRAAGPRHAAAALPAGAAEDLRRRRPGWAGAPPPAIPTAS